MTRVSLADQAYAQLRAAIAKGRLNPGTPIVESEIASMLGVSRTPVREALRRCELEGYVRRTASGSLIVVRPTAADIEKLFFVRELLEGYAVRLAVSRISDEELDRLDELVSEDQRALRQRHADRLAELNDRIHTLILEASRNRTLGGILRGVRARAWGLDTFAIGSLDERRQFVEDHARLARLLRDGDGERAEALIRAHLRRASELLVRGLEDGAPADAAAAGGSSLTGA